MILKAGTILNCPECGADQLKTTKDVLPGTPIKDAGFESLGFDMNNLSALCHSCGTAWSRKHPKTKETQIHTKDGGWVSLVKTANTPSQTQIYTTLH